MEAYERQEERSNLPKLLQAPARGTRAEDGLIQAALGGGLVVPDLTEWLASGEILTQPHAPPLRRPRPNLSGGTVSPKVANLGLRHEAQWAGYEGAHVSDLPPLSERVGGQEEESGRSGTAENESGYRSVRDMLGAELGEAAGNEGASEQNSKIFKTEANRAGPGRGGPGDWGRPGSIRSTGSVGGGLPLGAAPPERY
jgi:hypothetical protein